MTLADLEEGSAVFVDANVLIYHFVGASPECTALLARCETREVRGIIYLTQERCACMFDVWITAPR